MPSMTPIKYIGSHKTMVFTVDYSDMMTHVCVTFSEEQADWMGWSLAKAHNVEHRKFDAIPATYIRESE